jgi:hypothetical protein
MFNMIKKILVIFILFLVIPLEMHAQCVTDIFGVAQFYPSLTGTGEWNSNHWNNGIDRTIKYASDPYDPTDWTEDHRGNTNGFHIDGVGVMDMSGGSPRFHINSTKNTKIAAQFFLIRNLQLITER